MKSNNLLKNVDIKNCICFYFDGSLSINDFDLQNILLDEKLHEKKKKNSMYDVAYKILSGAKLLLIILIK